MPPRPCLTVFVSQVQQVLLSRTTWKPKFPLTTELEIHKDEAHKSRQYYLETTKRCHDEWDAICSLESKEDKTEDELSSLDTLKHGFTLTALIIRCKNSCLTGGAHLSQAVRTTAKNFPMISMG